MGFIGREDLVGSLEGASSDYYRYIRSILEETP
jgi:hypothetical protein